MLRQLATQYGRLVLITIIIFFIFVIVNRDTSVPVKNGVSQSKINLTNLSDESRIDNNTQDSYSSAATNVSNLKDFFVFNRKCKIPRVNPFNPNMLRWVLPQEHIQCSNDPDVIHISFNPVRKQYVIHVDSAVIKLYYTNNREFACIYREIARGNNDSVTWQYSGLYFQHGFLVPRSILGIVVECHETANASHPFYSDAFAFIQYPTDRNEENDKKRSRKLPSIIMLGIDAMSQMNFQRTMPLTAQFVRRKGFYPMQGFNKIGDNTLPNLLTILSGRTPKQWKSYCNITNVGCLDALTYLWNHFHNAGYLTAYAEDLPSIDTFHYLLPGFMRVPVNYYLRPFITGIELMMKTQKYFHYNYCVGRKESYRYVLDFCQQLIDRFVQETQKPIFGLFWTNSFSHDDFTAPTIVDANYVRYLKSFEDRDLFEKAIVILFSDHGQRHGPLLEIPSSFLEERLPMLHIYLPPWYRKKYPNIANAMQFNKDKLCSPYDLHLTIKKFLGLELPQLTFTTEQHCRGCQSLTMPLPEDRGCLDALIPDHWCTCDPYIQVPIKHTELYLTRLIVSRMNKYLSQLKVSGLCRILQLKDLIKVERKQHFDANGKDVTYNDGVTSYLVRFITKPNDGLYRATVWHKFDPDSIVIEHDYITRLNPYRNQSYCVNERKAKEYCMCKQSQFGSANITSDYSYN